MAKTSTSQALAKLYAKVPTFQCIEGCTDCCGPVPFAREEWRKIKDKRQATGVHCAYAVSGQCDIYGQRPFLCRLFGAVDDPRLTCPHGCGATQKMGADEAAVLMREYAFLLDATP